MFITDHMGSTELFLLVLMFTTALCNHNTRICGRTLTGRIVCTRPQTTASRSGTRASTGSTRRSSTTSSQNSGFIGRFSGGFGPNARLGIGLLGSDLIRPQSFGGINGPLPPGRFLGSPFGPGPFRRVPNRSLARWSRLPGRFF